MAGLTLRWPVAKPRGWCCSDCRAQGHLLPASGREHLSPAQGAAAVCGVPIPSSQRGNALWVRAPSPSPGPCLPCAAKQPRPSMPPVSPTWSQPAAALPAGHPQAPVAACLLPWPRFRSPGSPGLSATPHPAAPCPWRWPAGCHLVAETGIDLCGSAWGCRREALVGGWTEGFPGQPCSLIAWGHAHP